MSEPVSKEIETPAKPEKRSPGYNFGGPGPGRPKGLKNKITLQQRRVAAMVLGEPGTKEFDDFVVCERLAALDGSMAPGVKTLWMHYLLGVPKVQVEVSEPSDVDDLSVEELRERSIAVASSIVQLQPVVEESEATH